MFGAIHPWCFNMQKIPFTPKKTPPNKQTKKLKTKTKPYTPDLSLSSDLNH
jgi:hypothetical protein